MQIPNLKDLTNEVVVEKIEVFRQKENEVISDMVLHLFELDQRGYYRDLGYSSLFSYLTEGLKYSEGAAQRRIRAARSLGDDTEIYFKLREGKISLCALCEISKVTERIDRIELISKSEGKSKREVEKLVAVVLPPSSPKRETTRMIKVALPPNPTTLLLDNSPPPVKEPVEERYSINMEVDKEFMQLLEKGKALTGKLKNSDLIKQALPSLIEKKDPLIRHKKLEKRQKSKLATVSSSPSESRYIPIATRDTIFVKDKGCCSFVGIDGRRCTETHGLQIDHVRPWAMGGTHEEGNLRVLCRSHNLLEAQRVFGEARLGEYLKK